jgi:hypothetical protein
MDMITLAIFDLTKANFGTESRCAASAYGSLASLNVGFSNLTLVILPHQERVKSEFPGSRVEVVSDYFQAPNVISGMLSDVARSNVRSLVMLFSYNGEVLRLASRGWGNVQVVPSSFSRLMNTAPFSAGQHVSARRPADSTWRFDHVAPLDDALRILLDVLRKNGCRSEDQAMRQASIRPLMGADHRFRGSSAITGTSGMMKQLLDIAEARGLVGVRRVDAVNPLVWIKDEPATNSAVARASAEVTSVSPEAGGEASEVQQNSSIEQLSSSRDHAAPARGPATAQAAADNSIHRSRVLGQVLREQNMGPYAEARSAMECSIAKHGDAGFSVDELMSKAIDDARIQMGETDKKQPWKAIEDFYRRILLKWGALLDENGEPIRPGWGSGSARVKALVGNWTVLIDEAMLLALVEKVDDICDRDTKHLARAIYRQPPGPENMKKITLAVTELIRQGRVEEVERNGLLVLRPKSASTLTEEGAQPERVSVRLVK